MSKIISISLLLWCIIPCAYSQTYYYQLSKKVSDNSTETQVSGGQFITFMADICYESTAKGFNVGHGKLTRRSSNNQFKEYRGDSYWGKATFKFKSDLSKLNVITEDGEIWVYTRTTAPSSAKTCSLIRKGGRNSHSNSSDVHNPYSPTINNNTVINNYGGGNSNEQNTHSGNQHSTGTWITKQCTACNGTGKSIAKNYAPYYGGTRTKSYCNICNGYEYPHSHKTCGICKGKGYVKEYKY